VLLSALGATTVMITTHYSNISGNNKASVQALHVAEAGAEEARNRLRRGKTLPIDPQGIQDTLLTQNSTEWLVYIGTEANATSEGYTSGNDHSRVESFPTLLNYTVRIRHARDGAGYTGNIRKTASGDNIYEVTSYGSIAGARSIVQTYIAAVPSLPMAGTVYVEAATSINGNVTIEGADRCDPVHPVNRPAIATPRASTDVNGAITVNGNPTISVSGPPDSYPPIQYGDSIPRTEDINVRALAETYARSADLTLTDSSMQNVTTAWGTPDLTISTSHPIPTCTDPHIITYTGDLSLNNITGCGALVINGTLDIRGNFQWYGPIIVTGRITLSGGGSDSKNIMGAVLSGDSAIAQVPDAIGGHTTITNCSKALKDARTTLPWTTLSWGTL